MYENYEKIFFVVDSYGQDQVLEAIKGLDAMQVEATYDQDRVYFYILINPKDQDEFNRRLNQH